MKSKNLWITVGVVVVALIIVGVVITQRPEKPEGPPVVGPLSTPQIAEVVKFGAILPLTGNLAKLGEPKKEAFQLAVEDINAGGGIKGHKVELVLGDNKGDPKEGVTVLQKQINLDKVKLFYVDITRVAYACVPAADANKVIMFAGSTHPAITEGSPWVFRVFTSGDQESDLLAEYLVKQKAKTIYILYTDDILGESFKEYLTRKFGEKGGKVVGSDSFKEVGQQDFKTVLSKAKASNADKIVLIGYGVAFPTLIQQLNELKIPHDRVIGNIGFVGPKVAGLDPALTDGMVFTGPSFTYRSSTLEDPKVKGFVGQYQAKYGKVPDYTAAFAYDTIMILAQVIGEGGDDVNVIRQGLLKIKDYEGVSGKITFRPNGDTFTDTSLAGYKGNKISLLE